MTDLVAMTVGMQCFADGRVTTGAAMTALILVLQVGFGLILRRRADFAGRPFFLIANGALAYWLLLSTLEQWTQAAGCKVLFSALTYPGIALVPVAWAMFIHRYCFGLRGPIRAWQGAAMVVVPLTLTTMALTSPQHGLFYAPGTGPVGDWPGAPVNYVHGPLFAAGLLPLYLLMLWSLYMLSRGYIAARASYRLHFGLLLLLTLAPLVANLAHVLGGAVILNFDPTPFFFIVTAMAYAVIILTNNHFDIVGIARKDFFDDFPTPLAVVDATGRLQTMNRAAAAAIAVPDLTDRLRDLTLDAALGGRRPTAGQMMTLGARSFRVSLHPVLSPLGRDRQTIGWMAAVEDVTAWQEMIAGLTAALQEQSSALERSRAASERLESLAVRDPLTGALNRRGLENALKALMTEGTPPAQVGIALVDIDHFKQINDRFGHPAGDAVLVRFADILMRTFRRGDLVFRVGGEEFLVLGPTLDTAAMAERLDHARAALAADPLVNSAVPDGPVRFSAGLDLWVATGQRPMTEVMRSVDALLYAAKSDGRNRTTTAEAA